MKPPVLEFRGGELLEAGGAPASWPSLALLGHPVAHSESPRLHQAALQTLGLEGDYRAVELRPEDLGAAVREARRAGCVGLQLTLPHKREVLAFCGERSAAVLRLGAANTLCSTERGWAAHNTDLPGLVRALRRVFPGEPWRGPCAVVGAGGAARACLAALEDLGSGPRRVLARSPERATWVGEWGTRVEALDSAELGELRLLLQATPLGLHATDPSPVDPRGLSEGCAVMDLCYGREPSRLLREHRGRGPVADGREMLLAQAELAFQLWFPGHDPHDPMRAVLFD